VRSPGKKVSRILWAAIAVVGFFILALMTTYIATELEETRLGPIGAESLSSSVVSGDGHHLAYVERRGKRQFVAVDGQAGVDVGYDLVHASMVCAGTCTAGPLKDVIFSPDSKHLACAARIGQKWSVVIDGRAGREHDLVDKLIFSPDSKRFAYLALREPLGAVLNGQLWHGTIINANEGTVYGSAVEYGAKLSAVVDGQPGPEYDVFLMDSLIFSPDSRHLAYAVGNGRKRSVVLDGRPSPEYDGLRKDSMIFSSDSKHLAYAAKSGRKWSVVDGQRGPEYDGVATPIFSPDSKRVAYGAEEGEKQLVVVDGKASPEYDRIGRNSAVFSPDSKRVAYAAKNGQKWSVVVDGQTGAEYDGIGRLMFSRDSKRVAYTAARGKEQFVVMDNEVSPGYDGIGEGPIFSSDSTHLAYSALKDQKQFVLVDDHASAAYDGLLKDSLIFSPDSKRFAYAARKGQKWFVVVDGHAGPEYESVLNGCPAFSPDSKRLAYAARSDRKWFVVAGGTVDSEYDAIFAGSLVFSPDGTLGYLALREGSLYRVEHTPAFLPESGLVSATSAIRSRLRRVLRAGPYDGMVGALHHGMSGEDVANALGQPCQRIESGGWTYLHYLEPGTNMLLVVSIGGYASGPGGTDRSRTINEWAILVPQGQDRSDGSTAYPAGDGSACSVGQGCSLQLAFDGRGQTIRGISCTGVHYEVAKEQILRP
jgi:Tol biopolymer transport system component